MKRTGSGRDSIDSDFDIFDKIRLISEFKGIGILLIRINETNSKEHKAMIRILIY